MGDCWHACVSTCIRSHNNYNLVFFLLKRTSQRNRTKYDSTYHTTVWQIKQSPCQEYKFRKCRKLKGNRHWKVLLFRLLCFTLHWSCILLSLQCFTCWGREEKCKNCTKRVKSLTYLVRQPAVSQLMRAEQTVPGKLQRGQAAVDPTQPIGARQHTVGLVCHDCVNEN